MKKYSVTLDGHRTSVSLEPDFWAELKRLAEQENLSIDRLVARIDHQRGAANLSSAIRLHILAALRPES